MPYTHVLTFVASMYDRKLKNPRPVPIPTNPVKARIVTLTGVIGIQMAKYRATWKDVTTIWFQLIWRPHLITILVFEVRISENHKFVLYLHCPHV